MSANHFPTQLGNTSAAPCNVGESPTVSISVEQSNTFQPQNATANQLPRDQFTATNASQYTNAPIRTVPAQSIPPASTLTSSTLPFYSTELGELPIHPTNLGEFNGLQHDYLGSFDDHPPSDSDMTSSLLPPDFRNYFSLFDDGIEFNVSNIASSTYSL
jgi:hypothetical protein